MRIFSVFAVGLLGIAPQTYSQQPAAPPPAPTLKLFVLQGNNAVNDITGRTAITAAPTVEVRDLNDQPVEGAEVIFELPASGPGGSFAGNKITFMTRTGVQGQASGPFTPNTIPGRFVIQVTATSGDRFGRVAIQQTNGTVAIGAGDSTLRHSSRKKWLILAGAAAAAVAVGVVLATRGSTPPVSTAAPPPAAPPTIVITAGPPVFGGR